MKEINYQINKYKNEYNPNWMEQNFTFAVVSVQIGNNIAYPGKHGKEYKKEVEKTINV